MYKTVVSYAYFETDNAMYNFDFFINTGIVSDVLFIIIINGYQCSVEIPELDNVIIIRRENIGFDTGAHGAAIEYLFDYHKTLELPFDYYIFMNCSAIGPFLPSYFSGSWTNVFTSKITDKVKLVGTSIVSIEYGRKKKVNYLAGPNVEGFCFCLDRIGFNIIYQTKTVFVNHRNKNDAIQMGEFGLSKPLLNQGYSIDCLLYRYHNVDWTNENECISFNNNYKFASRCGNYDGIYIHPFEVVFHKWYWINETQVNFEYVDKYRQWKLLAIHKKEKLFIQNPKKISVTKKFSELYLKGNKLVIPDGVQCDVHIYGNHYSVVGNGCSLMIDNEYDLKASYGDNIHRIDVTHKFINTCIKDGIVNIPENYPFDALFDKAFLFVKAKLFLTVRGIDYEFDRVNCVGFMIEVKHK